LYIQRSDHIVFIFVGTKKQTIFVLAKSY